MSALVFITFVRIFLVHLIFLSKLWPLSVHRNLPVSYMCLTQSPQGPTPRLHLGPEAQARHPHHLPHRRHQPHHQGRQEEALLQGCRRHREQGVRGHHGVLQRSGP